MADSKDVVGSDSQLSPEFIQELLPSAERTALLYHLSFLCLGGFPKLERMIRDQAIETQMLFVSSEAVLLKCAGTSSNLVTSLFPVLIKAVEKNKPVLAVLYLEKARTWIEDIVRAVDDMVKRYDQRAQSVKTCTSDVYQEQNQTEGKIKEKTVEMKALEDALVKLKEELKKNDSEMTEIENKIKKNTEEQEVLIKNNGYRRSFFWGLFSYYVHYNNDAIRAKQAEQTTLIQEKDSVRNKKWEINIKQTDLQLKLANCNIQLGAIPSPVHLKQVQKCLDQIRQILVDLNKFWMKVGVLLGTLKDKTFAGDKLIEYLEDMKEEFLNSIEEAKLYWKRFGECCQRAQGIFSVQSKDAYKFLEVNPSSLSEAERNKQYNSIMEKLKKINPQGSAKAAITA
ncbi:putative leucine-rich repeat-containing protein DDB_G0290503 [Chanodichthys erythropterus]|uniref:putative leucine-rich repeat-containing protein DDB_G0290503 n=1 Tax=Chanodichthys erythropterus TaxID=933992 RepID=UPI00351E286B